MCFTATVVTGLFQEINLLIVELLAGLYSHFGQSMMTTHWFQGYYVCINLKNRFAPPGLLQLVLLVITPFSLNGPFMEKLVYCAFCLYLDDYLRFSLEVYSYLCLVQLSSNGSGSSNEISPVYSLWATFMGLYIANYVVERSTGYANCQLSKHFSLSHFYRNFLLMNLHWRNLGNADYLMLIQLITHQLHDECFRMVSLFVV